VRDYEDENMFEKKTKSSRPENNNQLNRMNMENEIFQNSLVI
jgi:hypothetical protein